MKITKPSGTEERERESENEWLAKQVQAEHEKDGEKEQGKKAESEEPRGPGPRPHNESERSAGFEAVKTAEPSPVEMQYGPAMSAEDGISAEDTKVLYGDPNRDMMQQEDASMIERIAGISNEHINEGDNAARMFGHVYEAMHTILQKYTPTKITDDNELLDIMRLATMMGFPLVSEIYSPPRATALA